MDKLNMQKIQKTILAALFATLCITACSKKNSDTDASSTTSNSVTNDQLPADTLLVDVSGEVPSLDPSIAEDNIAARVILDLFGGLVDFDQTNKSIPGMASSWDISPDGKTYIFHLRDGLKFSDGTAITAKDFVYSWQRLVDPKIASTYNWLLDTVVNGKEIMASKLPINKLGVQAVDDKTLKVELVTADPAFIAKCAFPNLFVIPQHTIEKYGTKWTEPQNMVTSGAYTLKEHVVNGYILAEKNQNYYDAQNVAIAKVKYFPYVDTNASLASYKTGGLDMTFTNVPVDQYKQIKAEYPTQLNTVRWEAIGYYDFNMKLPEFRDNLKLRKALTMAIDRNVIANEVMAGGQTPLNSVLTPTIEQGKYANITYDWASWPRDKQIAEAKKLYQEAGYGATKPLKVTVIYNTNDINKKVALAVTNMWSQVLGVQSVAQNQEWKNFLQTRHKGDYQIARDGWVADYDSVTTYTALYLCNSGQNNSHYCNPEYDNIIAEASNTTDSVKQQELYQKALNIVLNDYAVIPIFQNAYQRLLKPRVKNLDLSKNYLDHSQSKWAKLTN